MKKFDCLCLGACVLDVSHTNDGKSFISLGGDAANQAVILSRLGMKSALISLIGKDEAGEKISAELLRNHVDTSLLVNTSSYMTTVSHVYFDENRDRRFQVIPGAHRHFQKKHFPIDCLSKTKALSLGSLFSLHELEEDGLLEILQEAKRRKVYVFSDTSNDRYHKKLSGIKKFLPYIDYFMPSFQEAADLCDEENIVKIMEKLHVNGARRVIIKAGSDGAYASDQHTCFHVSAFETEVADTSGCGDNFCAGMIASVLNGFSLKKSVENGCYAGSYNARFHGASSSDLTFARMIEKK